MEGNIANCYLKERRCLYLLEAFLKRQARRVDRGSIGIFKKGEVSDLAPDSSRVI